MASNDGVGSVMFNGANAISFRSNSITKRIGSTGCGTVQAQHRMNGMQG